MAYLTLLNTKNNILATNVRIIPAVDVSSFQNVIELSKQLVQLAETEDARIKVESVNGYNTGYEAGLLQGKEDYQNKLSEELMTLHFAYQKQRQLLAESAIDMALQMVKKIARNLGSEKVVAEITQSVAEEFIQQGTSRRLRFHVAPKNVPAVESTIKAHCLKYTSIEGERINCSIDVVEDYNLTEFDCVVETDQGKSIAGLECQLDSLSRILSNYFHQN